MDTAETLLKGILATVARSAFPPETLRKIVAPTAGSEKQILAYNLCDGATAQADICKKARLDAGYLSRTLSRWVEAGIVIRIGEDRLPLHVYPFPTMSARETSKK